MSFLTAFNSIQYVEVDDEKISMFKNKQCLIEISKSALSAMIMLYESILLDLEKKSSNGQKFYSDENTVIYTKKVLEIDENDNRKERVKSKVLCILHAPVEVVFKKEAFQMMVISAAIACRIKADKFRSPIGSEYELNDTQLIIFHSSKEFSIVDEKSEEQFSLPVAALAKMIMLKKDIMRDLRAKNYFGETIYWSNGYFQIKSQQLKQFRMLSFLCNYQGSPSYIRIKGKTFEEMVHIATSGPRWTDNMDHTMARVRELFWKSIPINTCKSIDFSKDGKEFTLINEVNNDTLTLPINALKAVERNRRQILSDLEDYSFMPTHEKDYMNEYWTDGNYVIRTGAFINLSREIDCNVVRFIQLRGNGYKFVVQKKAFLKLLDELKNLEYY